MRWLAEKLIPRFGWRFSGDRPTVDRYVVVAAPHTSNWDFIIFLAVTRHFGINGRVVGKHTLVRWPFGSLMRRLGVIPIQRDSGQGLVEQIVAAFAREPNLALTVAPEGTRRAAPYWRSGFYHIAMAAKVPMVLAFIDGERKIAGLGPTLHPSGDIVADMGLIRRFYEPIRGINPDRQGPIRLDPGLDSQAGI